MLRSCACVGALEAARLLREEEPFTFRARHRTGRFAVITRWPGEPLPGTLAAFPGNRESSGQERWQNSSRQPLGRKSSRCGPSISDTRVPRHPFAAASPSREVAHAHGLDPSKLSIDRYTSTRGESHPPLAYCSYVSPRIMAAYRSIMMTMRLASRDCVGRPRPSGTASRLTPA